MDITKQEISILLRGWQEEKRIVKCGVNFGSGRVSQIVGTVDVVEDLRVHISATRLQDVAGGDHFWVEIPLIHADRYVYVEGHEAPAEFVPDIAEFRHKGMIGIESRNGLKFSLLALRTEEERAERLQSE